jgi:endonuclease YncB( thermonuclease family)
VVDGDTVTVETLGHIVTVRVFGIDCPEKNQPGGSHATWFTNEMVMGRTVQVAGHSTDRYSRVVGEIGLADGRDLGRELVKTGNAWWYAKFDPYDAEMEDLEAAARQRRIGLWEAYNPVPPWEWRKIGHPRGRLRTASR